jgi:hypothetical protein
MPDVSIDLHQLVGGRADLPKVQILGNLAVRLIPRADLADNHTENNASVCIQRALIGEPRN